MTELVKSTKAERAKKRLAKLEKRKNNRWRIDDGGDAVFIWLFSSVVGCFVFAIISALASIWTQDFSVIWITYGAIFGGGAIALGIERTLRNIYECGTIYLAEKSVKKFRESGDIFAVNSELVNTWKHAIRGAGGDVNHASVTPQKHWGVFDQLVELDEMRKHPLTSQQRKIQIGATMDSIISDAVTPLAKQIKNERQRQEQIAQAEAMTEQQLHDFTIGKRLELIGGSSIEQAQNKQLVNGQKAGFYQKVKAHIAKEKS